MMQKVLDFLKANKTKVIIGLAVLAIIVAGAFFFGMGLGCNM